MKRILTALVSALLASSSPVYAADPGVLTSENAGLLFTDNPAGVSGVDAGFSIPIGKQVLWVFGDIFLLHPTQPEKPYVGAVSNAGLLVPQGKGIAPLAQYRFLTDDKTGLPRPLVENAPDEGNDIRLWPADGWHDEKNKRLYLYYGAVQMTGSGTYDFRPLGHGIAWANTQQPPAMTFQRLRWNGAWNTWKGGGPVFGTTVVSRGPGIDDWLYVGGVEKRGADQFGKMARVRRTDIIDPNAYEYFAGYDDENPRWSRRLSDAADVSGLRDMPSEMSIRYNAHLNGYLAVHSVGLEDRIRLSLAEQPWGPFRKIAEIGAPRPAFSKTPCYAGKEHAELSEQNGKVIYITYVDQQRYWLQLLRVTLR